jgi:flagellar export protein FliJ
MAPGTRLDKVVWLRERAQDEARATLGRAQAEVGRARDDAARAGVSARRDVRAAGPVDLWQLEEAAHHRALKALRAAEAAVAQAVRRETAAREGWAAARQGTEVVRRIQERRRGEQREALARVERRDADEVATLRFNAGR